MRALNSIRGLSLCLPVLAEALRKQAEQLDDTPGEQEDRFQEAINLLQEAEAHLKEHNITSPERWREVYQNLGCTYRSRAWVRQIRLKQSKGRQTTSPRIQADYQQAQQWLERALKVSEGHQPNLIVMDIHEDLAVIYVNADEYDQRVYQYLDRAEAIAPDDYKIKPGSGIRDLPAPIRGYWRELGQCQLQRMLSSFGKYDVGFYQYQNDQTRTLVDSPRNPKFLDEAVEHVILMFGYLLKYANRPMLEKAEQLMLRELSIIPSVADLETMSVKSIRIARGYQLERTETLDKVQGLFDQAIRDAQLRSVE
jgi:tetratricopeptide (TPR) repeat protein